jgi:hypothetical protein
MAAKIPLSFAIPTYSSTSNPNKDITGLIVGSSSTGSMHIESICSGIGINAAV